jgi:hypothetical protein
MTAGEGIVHSGARAPGPRRGYRLWFANGSHCRNRRAGRAFIQSSS